MKRTWILTAAVMVAVVAGGSIEAADVASTDPSQKTSIGAGITLKLWEGDPPHFLNDAPAEKEESGHITNVTRPEMMVYVPTGDQDFGHRMGVIFCPGGAYLRLSGLTGAGGLAKAFASKHAVAAGLKYRLDPPSTDVERDAMADGKRAIRLMRMHAKEWGIDPHRIGLMGASAGANLTLNVATHPDAGDTQASDPIDREDARPDFVVMLSPWPHSHDVGFYPVPKDASPALICTAKDDHTAPSVFAEGLAKAYNDAGVPVKLWEIPRGGHAAFSFGSPSEGKKWPDQFWPWVDTILK